MNTKEDEILKKRITELADRSYRNGIYTFTDFLSLADAATYYELEQNLKYAGATFFGGNDNCERKILRFGNKENLGYEEEFPIVTLCISPLMAKFSDDLGHRDILGSLMNLGIERSVLGDIIIKNNVAYVFCLSSIAEYICENLSRIKHTSVLCKPYDGEVKSLLPELKEIVIQIQSERVDAVISKTYNLSRSQVIPYFQEKKVFVNGRLMENVSHILKEKDTVTVRGFGRFEYSGIAGTSRKGKIVAKVKITI